MSEPMKASFSMLIMSIASSAAEAMGLEPDHETGLSKKNKEIARFNIDLLIVLSEKTKNNLTLDEKKFLDSLISDLQLKFVSM